MQTATLQTAPVAQMVENLPAQVGGARNAGLIPGLGRCPEEGNGYPLQYSCLENSMDRGAWRAIVHGVTTSWTRLSNFHLQVLEGSRKMESRKHQESLSPPRQ